MRRLIRTCLILATVVAWADAPVRAEAAGDAQAATPAPAPTAAFLRPGETVVLRLSYGIISNGGETRFETVREETPEGPRIRVKVSTTSKGIVETFYPLRNYSESLIDAVNARGDALRTQLQELCRAHRAPMCVTGIGSLFTIHGVEGPVRSNLDLTKQDQRIKELLFFDLLEQGIYLARRGMAALSFEIDDAACAAFTSAFDQFLKRRAALFATDATSLRRARD